ncbi:hypothetical protein BLNAU_15992 [Blattamonas nauphoetae]|uniref:SET domain-containing protein n=1 Tax=Blattamonas nauphoetae TaxID=2049346 RepID=A0ABQ9X930_9EUKA|nr:hypothetical protein BLNAU_15992 [Blattamonas nauphoetae]
MALCDQYQIHRMFGCFVVGFAFCSKETQNWILTQMFAPSPYHNPGVERVQYLIERFLTPINEFITFRAAHHPTHWNVHLKSNGICFTEETLFFLWYIWTTNAHSFPAYFNASVDPNSDPLSKDQYLQTAISDEFCDYREIPVDEGSSLGTAIFELGSRITHSCAPNMIYSMNLIGRPQLSYRVVREISQHVLLSFSYIGTFDLVYLSTKERREDLERHKYFFCLCPRCRGEDFTRTLPTPSSHSCIDKFTDEPAIGGKTWCVRSDFEGWEYVHNHPTSFASTGNDLIHQHVSSVSSQLKSYGTAGERKTLDRLSHLENGQPVSFQTLSTALNGSTQGQLYWGEEIDQHFDLRECYVQSDDDPSQWIVKPWRCLCCSARFSEDEMSSVLDKELELSSIVRVAVQDDLTDLKETPIFARTSHTLSHPPHLSTAIESRNHSDSDCLLNSSTLPTHKATPPQNPLVNEICDYLKPSDSDPILFHSARLHHFNRLLSLLHLSLEELGPFHATTGILFHVLFKLVSRHGQNGEFADELRKHQHSPVKLLLELGIGHAAYLNHVTFDGLNGCDAGCLAEAEFGIRLIDVFEELEKEKEKEESRTWFENRLEIQRDVEDQVRRWRNDRIVGLVQNELALRESQPNSSDSDDDPPTPSVSPSIEFKFSPAFLPALTTFPSNEEIQTILWHVLPQAVAFFGFSDSFTLQIMSKIQEDEETCHVWVERVGVSDCLAIEE